MKVKNFARQILTVAAGIGIIGATLGAAVAQNLESYPQPFIRDGVWNDSVIVVGENAAASDVLGAIEIAASLQANAYSVQSVNQTGTTEFVASTGVKIEKGGNEFNLGDSIYSIDTSLTGDDLPDILADGTYSEREGDTRNDEDYEQELAFASGNGILQYVADEDDDERVDYYLHVDDSGTFYTYTLEFNDYVDYETGSTADASDDWEGSTIEIQGNAYTVTEVRLSGGVLDRMTLMAGETVRWLQQDQPLEVGERTIMVVNVDENGDKCGVEVDGVMRWIDVGSTSTFGSGEESITVGVLDAVTVHSRDYDQDTCEISVGSTEILLEDDAEVQVEGNAIEGTTVSFTEGTPGRLEAISILYEPDEEMFIAQGEAWTDPVFGNWKLAFAGMSQDTEEMEVRTSGDISRFTFTNIEGDEVELQAVDDDSTLGWGFDDEFLGDVFDDTDAEVSRAMLLFDGDYCDGVTDAENCAGISMLVVSAGGEARVIEIADIDEDNERVKVRDITAGTPTTDWRDADGSDLVDVGFASIDLEVDSTNHLLIAHQIQFDDIKTEGEAQLQLVEQADDEVRVILKEDDDGAAPATDVTFRIYMDSDDDQAVALVTNLAYPLTDREQDSDYVTGATTWGTIFTLDNENDDELTIQYPEEQAYGNVFLTPLSAEISSSGALSSAEKINAIPVGIGVLDVDAMDLNKNMIVVGGPCVNEVSADLEGTEGDCSEGYQQGTAKLKMFNWGGKAALLVAGFSAQDTLGASYVLAEYDKYNLSGTESEVAVASLTDISVTPV